MKLPDLHFTRPRVTPKAVSDLVAQCFHPEQRVFARTPEEDLAQVEAAERAAAQRNPRSAA